MLVTRWQAPLVPKQDQIEMMFRAEGLTPYTETFSANTTLTDHRHPFDEVRMVSQGEIVMDIAGNKLLLRAGDKVLIPSNTRHSFKVGENGPCTCVCANKTF